MNRDGKRCVIYVRVSTEMQVDGFSLDAQTNNLKRFAEREGMIVKDIYEDAGKSGKSIEGRPAFTKLLNDIKDGLAIDYVLVYKLSRFGRNAADILNSLELIHADEIIEAINEVFKSKFKNEIIPDGFAQKITYSAGDSNQLIRNFRIDKNFRFAVTVTLVATGTDVKPLEVVMFMADVKSDVLYTQMKGRGCRSINEDKLKEVTPNAKTKDCFYIIDAVGVTKGEKTIPRIFPRGPKKLSLKDLLEHLSHGELSDDNLALLRDYCSTITNRYKDHPLYERHLDEFIRKFDYSPIYIAEKIHDALKEGALPHYNSPSEPNTERFELISKLISNNQAKDKLLELKKGYFVFAPDTPDELINKSKNILSSSTKQKVCAYCRVSTDNEEQMNSFQSQVSYYKSLIGENDK